MGCIIYEGLMVKSNLTLPHKKRVILLVETVIHVLTFDNVKADDVLKERTGACAWGIQKSCGIRLDWGKAYYA